MILLADSGSTKTNWALVENGQMVRDLSTRGTNPFFQKEEEISNEIGMILVPQLPSDTVDDVYFYGAGCAFPDKIEIVKRAISKYLNVKGKFEVNSDMLAAARSLCGHEPGIACILGTGSNSCFYNGKKIVKNVSPLGFILGDEGSGAVLGKLLIGNILKNQFPAELKEKFEEEYHLTNAMIIDHVYTKSFPNRYLASFVPFLEKHIEEACIVEMLIDSFKSFLQRNVKQYDGYDTYPIHFNGSIAYFFREELTRAVEEMGMQMGKIEKTPMEGLIAYHS